MVDDGAGNIDIERPVFADGDTAQISDEGKQEAGSEGAGNGAQAADEVSEGGHGFLNACDHELSSQRNPLRR